MLLQAPDRVGDMADAQPFQSLYRRFRPQRFGEVKGQEHITRALRNAVREERVSHAYLFSGPRGTGKTSTARILAKALNCTDLRDGEPCDECRSCVEIRAGSSLDVHELDAASNNGIDAMRDLVSRAALGTPGRWKVYIVDEVHMLSAAASNALLKTLEEPPGHVVFVLATTDPQKVLPTIRSRTQHFEFRLISGDVLAGLLAEVNDAAGLGVSPEAIDLVMRRGHGSARDALSVLDQVAAAGDMDEGSVDRVEELIDAISDRDAGRALLAVAEACAAGVDARRMANDILEHLRNAFLLSMKAAELVSLPDVVRDRLAEQAARMGPAGLTRAMETVGLAVVDMREALDPRITLEVAVVRLARPDADVSPAALLERIEKLERGLTGHVSEPARAEARAAAAGAPAPGPARASVPAPVPAPVVPATPGPGPASGSTPAPTGQGSAPASVELGAPAPADVQQPPAPPPAERTAAPGEAGPAAPAEATPPRAATPASAEPARESPAAASRAALGAVRERSEQPPRGPAPVSSTPPPPPLTRPGPAPADQPPAAAEVAPAPAQMAAPPPAQMAAPPPAARATPVPASAPGSAGPGPATPGPVGGGGDLPSRDELTKAWGDSVLAALSGRARARYSGGRFVHGDGTASVFAVPNEHFVSRCEESKPEVEAALASHFGRPVPLRIVVDTTDTVAPEPAPGMVEDDVEPDDLREGPEAAVASPEERVMQAFPGTTEVEPK